MIAIAVALAMTAGATAVPATIQLTFHTLEPGGRVRVGLYESPAAYRDGKPVREASAQALGDVVKVEIRDLVPGTYALQAYQDRNDDGRLDTNLLGQPLEPVGFSNDAAPVRGKPAWDAVRFEAAAGATAVQTIRLR